MKFPEPLELRQDLQPTTCRSATRLCPSDGGLHTQMPREPSKLCEQSESVRHAERGLPVSLVGNTGEWWGLG